MGSKLFKLKCPVEEFLPTSSSLKEVSMVRSGKEGNAGMKNVTSQKSNLQEFLQN